MRSDHRADTIGVNDYPDISRDMYSDTLAWNIEGKEKIKKASRRKQQWVMH
ncbi:MULTISPECIES: hypothetical protein [Providencia]|uniref:Uncharacterized protein n=2 Tax=Providencia TaxID=586 RepID=A0AAE2ZH39_PRORE|nr:MULTISPECIES: hypothetical protein [Providencia]MBN6366398.1 hypothetical protein [Providencia rettgeri]MBW3118434.1 hypothetical protein [Providencia rettgeri]MCL0011999.1 hypothetical protein [Providencia rettgeri]NHN53658.1 hypothetical protein [Providencia rettgeri]WNK23741.1 hypothetical protein PZ638_17700 [Providencia hangzhouensis]